MSEAWQDLRYRWERLRWARLNRTDFDQATAAAESLNIKPGTYRTYEYPLGEGGREPSISELQRICKKFKVSWVWVASGEGSPDQGVIADEHIQLVAQKAEKIPDDKKDDAWSAVMGVLDAYARKAG